MKTVILAGGLGTRLSEETEMKPKPMVEIGDRPILWHIMKHYDKFGYFEFIIALGYKGYIIKDYFIDYYSLQNNINVNLGNGDFIVEKGESEKWNINLVDTGLETNTGGRIGRIKKYIGDEKFFLTYGDGVSSVNISALLDYHQTHKCIATITAARPPARFGGLIFDGDRVAKFTEKPQVGEGWVNGGFMVMNPEIFDYIEDDATNLEVDVLEKLASEKQLAAYKHEGFWQCMDNLRDKRLLESLWQQGNAPWKNWE